MVATQAANSKIFRAFGQLLLSDVAETLRKLPPRTEEFVSWGWRNNTFIHVSLGYLFWIS